MSMSIKGLHTVVGQVLIRDGVVSSTGPTNNLLWTLGNGYKSVHTDGINIIAGQNQSLVTVWDITTGNVVVNISDPNPGLNQSWGSKVAISGQYAVVADWGQTVQGFPSAGTVYVFSLPSGALLHTIENITPSSSIAGNGDFFGQDLDISGDYLIIADKDTPRVYSLSTGTSVQSFTNPGFTSFGNRVAIDGDYAVISAPLFDSARGVAFIYQVSTGNLIHQLFRNNTQAGDRFGQSVDISGNYVIVGAPGTVITETNVGKVHIYDMSSGSPTTPVGSIDSPVIEQGAWFGATVSLHNNIALVNSYPSDVDGANDAGKAVYVCDVSTATVTQTITNPSPTPVQYFGYDVAIHGNYAVVAENSGPIRVYGP